MELKWTARQGAHPPVKSTEQPYALDIRALLLSESGRPNTLIIPPRMTRPVPVGLTVELPALHVILVLSRVGLLKSRSVFAAPVPSFDENGGMEIYLHNGGHEAYYVKHEEMIAHILLVPVIDLGAEDAREDKNEVKGPIRPGGERDTNPSPLVPGELSKPVVRPAQKSGGK